ncbi:MAG: FAD:protein FMN transferase [Gemmatimonadota bacterium]
MPILRYIAMLTGTGVLLALAATILLPAPGAPAGPPATTVASSDLERFEFAEVHMAMRVRIVLYAPDRVTASDAATAAFARIADLEDILSDYRTGSELRRLEERPGEWVAASEELFTAMEAALEMARLTDGAFDPTVGPVSRLWRDARRAGRLPSPFAIDSARALTGWEKLALDADRKAIRVGAPGMRLDLGGIAKGYILDEALHAAAVRGVDRVLLEAGGDIRVGAPPPRVYGDTAPEGWRIRMGSGPASGEARAGEADDAPAEVLPRELPPSLARRAGALREAALATSGSDAQFLEVDGVRYSHILDPRTGLGVTHHLTATVIAPTGMLADALATALSVLSLEEGTQLLAQFPEVEAAVHSWDTRSASLPESGAPR